MLILVLWHDFWYSVCLKLGAWHCFVMKNHLWEHYIVPLARCILLQVVLQRSLSCKYWSLLLQMCRNHYYFWVLYFFLYRKVWETWSEVKDVMKVISLSSANSLDSVRVIWRWVSETTLAASSFRIVPNSVKLCELSLSKLSLHHGS